MRGYLEIAKMETRIGKDEAVEGLRMGCNGFHESLTRAHHIVEKVKWLLEQKASPAIIRELIDLMESAPEKGLNG